MQRMTIYLPEELHAAICAHADAAGQKLSTFISRELVHLVKAKPTSQRTITVRTQLTPEELEEDRQQERRNRAIFGAPLKRGAR